MIPRSILKRLRRLQRREAFVRLVWGATRALAVVLGLLLIACVADYLIDRRQDTPWSVRIGMHVLQIAVAVAAGWFLIVRPLFSRLSESELALRIEDKYPRLEHRLITAVQLNEPGADTEGMSEELIAVVTREADKQTAELRVTRVADHRRLGWSVAVALPVAGVVAVFLLGFPHARILLARQLLTDVEIPRSVYLESTTAEMVAPSGEPVLLRFKVTGHGLAADLRGDVLVRPEGQSGDRYPLEFERIDREAGYFTAQVPPSTQNFTYRARLHDGRTRRDSKVRFVPRPVVVAQHAWLVLPAACGVKPDGLGRYEQPQPRGDVVGIPGSDVRLVIKTQKPIKHACVELLGPAKSRAESIVFKGGVPAAAAAAIGLLAGPLGAVHLLEAAGPWNGDLARKEQEVVQRTVPMQIIAPESNEGGRYSLATRAFDLKPEENAYRIVVVDEYGFENRPPPRRTLHLVAEEPPQVGLLREIMKPDPKLFGPRGELLGQGPIEDFEVEGMPVLEGGKVRIAYSCHGAYGLGQARLLFRVLKKMDSEQPATEEPWQVLPLPEVKASTDTGPFDLRRGIFQHTGEYDDVPFYPVPSRDPENVLGRTQGGGRYHFQTTRLPDGKGTFYGLKAGDQIEFCVEVFADKNPDSGRPAARSETRVKTIVSLRELLSWVDDTLQEERRIRKLEEQQRSVFGSK